MDNWKFLYTNASIWESIRQLIKDCNNNGLVVSKIRFSIVKTAKMNKG